MYTVHVSCNVSDFHTKAMFLCFFQKSLNLKTIDNRLELWHLAQVLPALKSTHKGGGFFFFFTNYNLLVGLIEIKLVYLWFII